MRLKPGNPQYGVHMTHCHMGEEFGTCKYGEHEICPALAEDSPQSVAAVFIKEAWKTDVAADRAQCGYRDYADIHGGEVWEPMLESIYRDLEATK